MQWTDLTRRLAKLAAASTLVLAACGGGDKNLGPETGGGIDTWDMVALGNAGLPAEAEVEDCRLTRFDHGKLELYVNDLLQNTATDVAELPGRIALQSEGAFIQWRNIRLTPR